MRSNYRRPAGRFGEDNGDDDFERPAIRPSISFPISQKPMRRGDVNMAVSHAYTDKNPILSEDFYPSLVHADDLSSLGNDHTVAGEILDDPLAGVAGFERIEMKNSIELYPAGLFPQQATPRLSTPVGALAAIPVQANPDEFTTPFDRTKHPKPAKNITDPDFMHPKHNINSERLSVIEAHETTNNKKATGSDKKKTEPKDKSSKRKKKKAANSSTATEKLSQVEGKEAKKKAKKKIKRKSKESSPPRAQDRSSNSNGGEEKYNFSQVPIGQGAVLQPLCDSKNGKDLMEKSKKYQSSNTSPSILPVASLTEGPLDAGKKLTKSQSEVDSLTHIPSITDEASIYQNSVLFDDFSVQPFDDDELKRGPSNRYVTSAPSRTHKKIAPFQYPKQGIEILKILEVTDEKDEEDKKEEHQRSDVGRSLENAISSTPKIRPPPKKKLFALPKIWGGGGSRRGGPVEI